MCYFINTLWCYLNKGGFLLQFGGDDHVGSWHLVQRAITKEHKQSTRLAVCYDLLGDMHALKDYDTLSDDTHLLSRTCIYKEICHRNDLA